MKTKALLYCTKAKPYLKKTRHVDKDDDEQYYYVDNTNILESPILNGKVAIECDIEVDEIEKEISSVVEEWYSKELLKNSCFTAFELDDYLKDNKGYAVCIKNLHIFDEPRELKDFDQVNNCCFEKEVDKDWEGLPIYACVFRNCCRYKSDGNTCDKHFYPLKRIHNMSKVFDNRDCKWKYVISLSPEEMCRIANKEQTTLVRRNMLKEMLKNE